jgi:hypothetical protein|tara:strand:- start:346 stop:483 length:138 start_codon:yes stop_codon:yes gene_type:complete
MSDEEIYIAVQEYNHAIFILNKAIDGDTITPEEYKFVKDYGLWNE